MERRDRPADVVACAQYRARFHPPTVALPIPPLYFAAGFFCRPLFNSFDRSALSHNGIDVLDDNIRRAQGPEAYQKAGRLRPGHHGLDSAGAIR